MDQRGLTVLELTVAIGVAAVILGALTTIVYRAGQGVDGNNSQIKVFREMEDAASFIGGDVSMAKFTDLVADSNCVAPYSPAPAWASTMTLQWTDYYNGQNVGYTSTYSLSGANLRRTYDGVAKTVASFFTSLQFCLRSTTDSGGYVHQEISAKMTVSGTEGPKTLTETKTYRFQLRPQ